MANQNLLGQNDRFLAQQQANQFNEDMRRRGLSTQEQMMQRQDPYNQLSQLLGLAGQVGNPTFGQTQQFGPMGVDYQGQVNQNYNQRLAGGFDWGGLISGAGQAGIAAFSDRRIKRNIKKLGELHQGNKLVRLPLPRRREEARRLHGRRGSGSSSGSRA